MKKIVVLTVCLMAVGMATSFAATRAVKPKESVKLDYELGTEVSHITYKEPGVMRERGMMYGLLGSCAYQDKLMLKAEGKWSWGQVDYKNSGTMNNINDYMLEFRGLAGYGFDTENDTTWTPYIGLGYRYLNDDARGATSDGALGYERESNYLYSPLGIEAKAKVENGWVLSTTAEFDWLWWGRQISHLGQAVASFGELRNTQRKGYGIRGSVKFQKTGEKIDFFIEPFIRFWNISKSKESDVSYAGVIVGYGYEPKNNSTEFGVKLGVKF